MLRKARYCTIIGQATCTFTGLPFNYALVYSTEPIDFMADIVLWILFLIIDIFFLIKKMERFMVILYPRAGSQLAMEASLYESHLIFVNTPHH